MEEDSFGCEKSITEGACIYDNSFSVVISMWLHL